VTETFSVLAKSCKGHSVAKADTSSADIIPEFPIETRLSEGTSLFFTNENESATVDFPLPLVKKPMLPTTKPIAEARILVMPFLSSFSAFKRSLFPAEGIRFTSMGGTSIPFNTQLFAALTDSLLTDFS